ncbi:flavin reductase family protein [Virgibacillus sp. DJP39]|uniref:flavin reductase family protein n=1 Tax=Virgibacillus sp. DJP39 TaxID=3409790 RepID=UPI003BB76EF3
MIIDQTQFDQRNMSKLIKGAVVPRPIAWVSSIDKNGIQNLAPFSFFTVASMDPITFCISIGAGQSLNHEKDTLSNIRETGEFVINMVGEAQANQMYETSKHFDPEENEFEIASLKTSESKLVSAPRVAGAPVNMECTLDQVIKVGNSHLVLGRLVCYHIKDEILMETDKVNPEKLKPVGRMGGDYTFVNDFYRLPNDAFNK